MLLEETQEDEQQQQQQHYYSEIASSPPPSFALQLLSHLFLLCRWFEAMATTTMTPMAPTVTATVTATMDCWGQ